MTGKTNEDRYAVSAFRLEDDEHTPSLFAIVADGVGGHRAGEVAAEIAVNTISHTIALSDGTNPKETLEYAIIQAGEAIHIQSTKDDEQSGMGSTCVCAWVIGDQLFIASVGDSRIYLVREDHIQQLTTDHTWVQEALEHGIIKPEQARNHPRSHIIRRYLGSKNHVVPDMRLKLTPDEDEEQAVANQGMKLLPGDQLILCSDGLSDLVEAKEILGVTQTGTLSEALSSLIEMANRRGGHDNITILAIKVPAADEVPNAVVEQKVLSPKQNLPYLTCAIISISLILIFLLGAMTIWYFGRQEATPTPTIRTETAIPATLTLPPDDPLLPTATLSPSDTPLSATITAWPTATDSP
jgi:protein phosphatase